MFLRSVKAVLIFNALLLVPWFYIHIVSIYNVQTVRFHSCSLCLCLLVKGPVFVFYSQSDSSKILSYWAIVSTSI